MSELRRPARDSLQAALTSNDWPGACEHARALLPELGAEGLSLELRAIAVGVRVAALAGGARDPAQIQALRDLLTALRARAARPQAIELAKALVALPAAETADWLAHAEDLTALGRADAAFATLWAAMTRDWGSPGLAGGLARLSRATLAGGGFEGGFRECLMRTMADLRDAALRREPARAPAPEAAGALRSLADDLLAIGDAECATSVRWASVSLDPRDRDSWIDLSRLLDRQGRIKEAYLATWEALRHIEGDAALWLEHGRRCIRYGAPPDRVAKAPPMVQIGVDAYKKAIELAPTAIEPVVEIAAATTRLKLRGAPRYIDLAMRLRPDMAEPYFLRGQFERYIGNLQAATKYYARALEIDPNHQQANLRAATLCQTLGRLESAATHVRRAVATAPDRAENLVVLGDILHGLGLTDDAVAAHERAWRLNPTTFVWWFSSDGTHRTLLGTDGVEAEVRREIEPWAAAGAAPISMLCATRGRPARLAGMIRDAMRKAHDPAQIECIAVIDHDDPARDDYIAALKELSRQNLGFHAIRLAISRIGANMHRYNYAAEIAAGQLLYVLADDLRFETQHWDIGVRGCAGKIPDRIFLLWCRDNLIDDNIACHPCVSRTWYETLNYVQPPFNERGYADVWLTTIAKRLGRALYLNDIAILHDHPWADERLADETSLANEGGYGGERLVKDGFRARHAEHWLEADTEKLRDVIRKYREAHPEAAEAARLAGFEPPSGKTCPPARPASPGAAPARRSPTA